MLFHLAGGTWFIDPKKMLFKVFQGMSIFGLKRCCFLDNFHSGLLHYIYTLGLCKLFANCVQTVCYHARTPVCNMFDKPRHHGIPATAATVDDPSVIMKFEILNDPPAEILGTCLIIHQIDHPHVFIHVSIYFIHAHDGSMVLVYMLTEMGYIDGIHGAPYIAAPWIRHGMFSSIFPAIFPPKKPRDPGLPGSPEPPSRNVRLAQRRGGSVWPWRRTRATWSWRPCWWKHGWVQRGNDGAMWCWIFFRDLHGNIYENINMV